MESLAKLGSAFVREADRARHAGACQPLELNHPREKRGAQCTAKVIAPLREVQALRGEQSSLSSQSVAIDAELKQPFAARVGNLKDLSRWLKNLLAL